MNMKSIKIILLSIMMILNMCVLCQDSISHKSIEIYSAVKWNLECGKQIYKKNRLNNLQGLHRIIDDPSDVILSKTITEIGDYQLIELHLAPKYPGTKPRDYWLFKDETYFLINENNVIDFINDSLYKKLDNSISKEDIIKLYDTVSFGIKYVKFIDKSNLSIDSEEYDKIIREKDYYRMRRAYLDSSAYHKEIWEIFYEFHWNKFSVRKILSKKEY